MHTFSRAAIFLFFLTVSLFISNQNLYAQAQAPEVKPAQIQPLLIDVSQRVPVTATLIIPIGTTDTMTIALPLDIQLDLRIQIADTISMVAAIEASEPVTTVVSINEVSEQSTPSHDVDVPDGQIVPAHELNSIMVGTASPELPPANDDSLQLIILKQGDGVVWAAVRNNTDESVHTISVDTTASVDDKLLAVGEGRGFRPNVLAPGAVSFGIIRLGADDLPADVVYDFDVSANSMGDLRFSAELTVSEYSIINNRIVGMLLNEGLRDVQSPIVTLICFDVQGQFLRESPHSPAKNIVEPKAEIPFQVDLPKDCPTFLIFAEGLSF